VSEVCRRDARSKGLRSTNTGEADRRPDRMSSALSAVRMLEAAGGDLGAWSSASATALVIGAFVGPAALSGWFARSPGRYEAFALALCAPSIELALVSGLAFLAFGYGDKAGGCGRRHDQQREHPHANRTPPRAARPPLAALASMRVQARLCALKRREPIELLGHSFQPARSIVTGDGRCGAAGPRRRRAAPATARGAGRYRRRDSRELAVAARGRLFVGIGRLVGWRLARLRLGRG
jgi:hypothetical protein